MQTKLRRVLTDTQENASGVSRIWQLGTQFINQLVQRAATGINNRLLTTMTVAALMMIAVYPAQAQGSFINLVNANSKCLQPINNSTTAGDAMILLPCDPKNAAQVWIQTASSGKFHFINYNSNRPCQRAPDSVESERAFLLTKWSRRLGRPRMHPTHCSSLTVHRRFQFQCRQR